MIQSDHVSRQVKYIEAQKAKKFEPRRDFIRAIIRSYEGSIRVPGHASKVWVSELGMPESLIPVVNHAVADVVNLPVIVGWDTKPPYEDRVIIGVDTSAGENTYISVFNSTIHAPTHEWPSETDRGIDPIRIWPPALRPLKTLYTGASLDVHVYRYVYSYQGEIKVFEGQSFNLGDYLPPTGQKWIVLTYLDMATNTAGILVGDPVGAAFDVPKIPLVLPNTIPSAAITLFDNTIGIPPELYTDVRPWLSVDVPNQFQATEIGQVLYSIDGVKFTPSSPLTNDAGWMVNDQGLLLVI